LTLSKQRGDNDVQAPHPCDMQTYQRGNTNGQQQQDYGSTGTKTAGRLELKLEQSRKVCSAPDNGGKAR
jgi:hypothetical protein